jgi:hypothetical protein
MRRHLFTSPPVPKLPVHHGVPLQQPVHNPSEVFIRTTVKILNGVFEQLARLSLKDSEIDISQFYDNNRTDRRLVFRRLVAILRSTIVVGMSIAPC